MEERENSRSLFRTLSDFADSGAVPMHMPGHKRNDLGIDFLERLGARYDITEIEGFDDLHHPKGILKEAMARAAELWGSDRCFFLVNGSTVGILAGIRAVQKCTGCGKIIMARNCHRSVYNAVELLKLEPEYIEPKVIRDFGFCGSIDGKDIEISLQKDPGTPIILTSPTYEGVMSNIAEIAVICHLYGSPLIVDSAHGAHLGLSKYFTGSAISAGADLVVQSVHKTLTGLNQTGLLHVNSNLIDPEAVARELSVFETSSPSYPLMASIDGTVELLANRGNELFSAWNMRLDGFDRRVAGLQRLKIPGHSEYFPCQDIRKAGYVPHLLKGENVYGYDRSKIVISCEGTSISGTELMRRLREDNNIYCEMAACGYVVAMTGIRDREGDMECLAKAVCEIDGQIESTGPRLPFYGPKLPTRRLPVSEAADKPSKRVFLRDALGKVSAEYVWAYPPGIPIVVPGEELTEDVINAFVIQKDSGVELRSTFGEMPKYIRVLK